ncbi:MAG: O-antigen ligase family protein [Flavobacterium sp.]|nr:O-antigen ligase family protein [Flavobacterium sp.]
MENIYSFFRTALPRTGNFFKNPSVLLYLLASILISIPLKTIFISLTLIAFVVTSFFFFKKANFNLTYILILPLLLYVIMLLSVFWTEDQGATLSGLQKELPFLFIPLVFSFIPKLNKIDAYKVFRLYSFSMIICALYYLFRATFKYFQTKNSSVFFYHELVTIELNAIYVSIFVSFALFYFISLTKKSIWDKVSLFILSLFIFLLSSKSVITIDFIMIICYYSFFAPIPKGIKSLTIIAVFGFVIFSLFFVKEVKDRFLLEYETAFVDNTINTSLGNKNEKVYNISLKQAWVNKEFQANNFFPGTALRVYQFRIFNELIKEKKVFFTGFGLEASQNQIRDKAIQHKLYPGYGEFNFHNQYIQTFSELGVFGFLVLILMLIRNIKNAWISKDFLHIVFAVSMIILFLSESFFCRQRGIVFFIIFYCIFNLIPQDDNKFKPITK